MFIGLFISSNSIADVGSPWIYAISKATMKDGKTTEGIIEIASGGYQGLWANGFNAEVEQQGRTNDIQTFFDLNFKFFEITNEGVGQSGALIGIKGKKKVTFMQWVEKPATQEPSQVIKKDNTLVFVKHIERNYLLKDKFYVYKDFPLDVKNSIEIVADQISKFELVAKPSKNWIDKVKISVSRANKILSEGTGDGNPPFWYHELIANNELYNEYQPQIARNLETY